MGTVWLARLVYDRGGGLCCKNGVKLKNGIKLCVFYKLGCVCSRLEGVVGSDEW